MTDINVTNATVRFLRRVQPAQYEPAEAEVTLTASAPEGGTITQEQTDALVLQAKKTVNAALGIANKVAAAGGEAAATTSKVTTTSPVKPAPAAAPAKPAAPVAAKPVAVAADAPKKGPGRPVGSTKKVEPTKPAATDDEFGAAAEASAEEPVAEEFAAAADDEFGAAAEAPAKMVTIGELQAEVTALIKAKRITVDGVKEVYGTFGQARSADLKPEEYAPALAMIQAAAKPAA